MKRSTRYSLSNAEQEFFSKACEAAEFGLIEEAGQQKLVETAVAMAQLASGEIPKLVENIKQLRNLRNSPGLIVIEYLPKVKDPRRLILIVGSILGQIAREANEGDYAPGQQHDEGGGGGIRPVDLFPEFEPVGDPVWMHELPPVDVDEVMILSHVGFPFLVGGLNFKVQGSDPRPNHRELWSAP